MIREWFSAQELAELKLSGMPHTRRGLNKKASSLKWISKKRSAIGGGYEYHISNLPDAARIELIGKLFEAKPDSFDVCDHQAQDDAEQRRKTREAGKLVVLKMFDIFQLKSGLPKVKAMELFCDAYETGTLEEMPEWLLDVYPRLSRASLYRWFDARKKKDAKKLGGQYEKLRERKTVLEAAHNGEVAEYLKALLVKQHHLSNGHLRDLVRKKFGDVLTVKNGEKEQHHKLPNIRSFDRFVQRWKVEYHDIYLSMTNPDASKNKHMMAFGRADADVTRLNQLWEIDASPADVLLVDGRYSIYAIVDVWSRRMMVLVSKTATTEASLLLVRRAIQAWGVPETIKTDNGADFVSKRFMEALISLDIEQSICRAFTPEDKPHVERGIGTLQRDFMALLPGFIGHNVTDRKQIEARKSFAQRLGVDDAKAFQVSLNKEQLQAKVSEWCEHVYERRTHSALGQSPFAKAATWAEPIRSIDDERALDILMAPLPSGQPTRIITKKGIRINHHSYGSADMGMYAGKSVFIRCDPEDMGTIHCFHPDTREFLFTAECPELTGASRKELAIAMNAAQKARYKEEKAELRRAMNKIKPETLHEQILEQARADHSSVSSFPQRTENYTTHELKEAAKTGAQDEPKSLSKDELEKRQAEQQKILKEMAEVSVTRESDQKRWFTQAKALMLKEQNGISLSDREEKQLKHWRSQPWFKTRLELEEMRRNMHRS